MGLTNLNSIGIVKAGVAFVWKSGPDIKQKLPFEGKELTVVGFMPASYVNRVVLKDPDGSEMLMPLSMIEKQLTSQQPLSKEMTDAINAGGVEGLSGKPKSEPVIISKEIEKFVKDVTQK